MTTFKKWLNNSESLEEWKKLGVLALAGASFLPQGVQAQTPNSPQAAMTQNQSQKQERLDAMQRVSSVHRFKKNWGSEFTPQQDQKIFDTIMKLQTEKDHDDFLSKIKKDQEDSMRGTAHPDPSVQQSEKKQVYNSFNYQFLEYLKALATASKMHLNQ